MFRFDPELIGKCIADLRPDRVNIFLMAKEFKASCDKTEPWFGTSVKINLIVNSLFFNPC